MNYSGEMEGVGPLTHPGRSAREASRFWARVAASPLGMRAPSGQSALVPPRGNFPLTDIACGRSASTGSPRPLGRGCALLWSFFRPAPFPASAPLWRPPARELFHCKGNIEYLRNYHCSIRGAVKVREGGVRVGVRGRGVRVRVCLA